MPTFGSLLVAYPGPEGPGGSPDPGAGLGGILAGNRKRAIANASFQINATEVCQLPNQSLETGIPAAAQAAIVVVEAANDTIPPGITLIRFWMDGSAPSTISGLPAYDGMPFEIIGADDLKNFRCISATGDQHVLQVQYFTGL
jgi:hypothetical protein